MILGLPWKILAILALPLLSPIVRPLFPSGRKRAFATVFPVGVYLLLLLFELMTRNSTDFPFSTFARLPQEGLLLALCLGILLLPILLILPERPSDPNSSRLPAVWLPCLLTSGSGVAFLGGGSSRALAGGAGLIVLLLLGALVLDGAFPGAYRRSFLLRLCVSGLLSVMLALRPAFLGTLAGEGAFLLALLLLFPAPLSRRTERVVSPEFLKMDMFFFQCMPPLVLFQLLRAAAPGFPGAFLFFGALSLGWGLLGLFRTKTAHYVQEAADGLVAAGMGGMAGGLLSGTAQGRSGGLFMALLLPQAALLGGMVLSSLVLRYRVRTVAGLSGAGTMIGPLRLAFLLAAFQGMSLPLVGGFMAEWRLLLGIWSRSPLLGVVVLAGLFFSFSLVLSFLRTIFSGEGPSLSRGDGEIVKTLWPGELLAFGTAGFFLLLTDLVSTRGGIFGGSP
ncbi:MAG: hypothetical protein ACP5OP_01520 [Leptospirillia bacterium]